MAEGVVEGQRQKGKATPADVEEGAPSRKRSAPER
jgi:hypothetical protein